jgi:hypothetical protein
MFRKFLDKLESLLNAGENARREAYLASSSDLAELERRNLYFDANHQPFAFYDYSRCRD